MLVFYIFYVIFSCQFFAAKMSYLNFQGLGAGLPVDFGNSFQLRQFNYKSVVWLNFFTLLLYIYFIICNIFRLLHWRRLIPTITVCVILVLLYFVEGPHTQLAKRFETKIFWCLYWVWLGVLSSIGFGSGLHTFVLFLV